MNESEDTWNAIDVSRKAEKEISNSEWNSRTTKKLDMLKALNKAGKFKKEWDNETLQGWVDQNYSWEKLSRQFKNLKEGTCGYSQEMPSGKDLNTPGNTKGMKADTRTMTMMREVIKKELKKLHEQGFDDRLKAAGGFSDEEFNDITSKDIGSSFPGPSTDVGNGVIQAQELIKTLKNNYKNMSDRELDAFSVEMTKHFLDNLAARDEAKIYLAKNPSNKMGENTTGTGASFQAGAGEAYATPKAFGKNKDKNIEVLGYKKI